MKQKIPYIIGAVSSLFFLALISALTFIIFSDLKQDPTIAPTVDTIYVYVNADTEGESETENTSSLWLIKEHNEKIGIFDKNGALIKLIDVYTKTLPKNDRLELQKGFWVSSEKELYSIIEAYSD